MADVDVIVALAELIGRCNNDGEPVRPEAEDVERAINALTAAGYDYDGCGGLVAPSSVQR